MTNLDRLLVEEGEESEYNSEDYDSDDDLVGISWKKAVRGPKLAYSRKGTKTAGKTNATERTSLDSILPSGILNNSRISGTELLEKTLLETYKKDCMRVVSLIAGARKKDNKYTIQRMCTEYLQGSKELNQKDFILIASVYCTATEVMQQTGKRKLTLEQELLARALAPAEEVYKNSLRSAPKDIRAHILGTKYTAQALGSKIELRKTKTNYSGSAVIGEQAFEYTLTQTEQQKINEAISGVYKGITSKQLQKITQREYALAIEQHITKQATAYLSSETIKLLAEKDYLSLHTAAENLRLLGNDANAYKKFIAKNNKKITTALHYCLSEQTRLDTQGSWFSRKSKTEYRNDLQSALAYIDVADALKQHTPNKSITYAYLRQNIEEKLGIKSSGKGQKSYRRAS